MPPVNRLGDVFEVRLSHGYVYCEYVFNHCVPPHWGPLIRVYDHVFGEPARGLDEVISYSIRFYTYVLLHDCLKQGLFVRRWRQKDFNPIELPGYKDFMQTPPREGPPFRRLWFVNNKRVNSLTPADEELSSQEIVSTSLLKDRLEAWWHPRDEVWYERWS